MNFDGRQFWLRFDELLQSKNSNIRNLCKDTGLLYGTINTQRTRHTIPKAEYLYLISRYLNVSIEHLLTGLEDDSILLPEAKAVQNDKELQALVRAILRDRRLLSAISAVVNSYEDNAHIG